MKKIMVLGGSYLQTFIIRKIRELGHYSIVLDMNENSEGFTLADKYYICSTTEQEKVLEIAKKEAIDGILTYASDVSAPTVAYVAEKLNLTGNPYQSVCVLTDKAKTRQFLQDNGFNVPKSKEVLKKQDIVESALEIGFPVIVKPVDSSGSKGVSLVESVEKLESAYEYALSFSRSKRVIVEEYICRQGYEIDADAFMHDGKLVYFLPMDQHQDPIAPFSPIGISGPSILDSKKAQTAFNELERLLSLLHMKTGAYNVEFAFNSKGEFFFYEIGPRSGGNLIPDAIHFGTGFDIQKNTVLACLGEKITDAIPDRFFTCVSSFIIHSQIEGEFVDLEYDSAVKKGIVFEKLFVNKGDHVSKFTNGMYAIGFCLIRFDDAGFMREVLDNSSAYIRVIVK